MKNNPKADLVIDVLFMALWHRKLGSKAMMHSEQGIQYTCSDWVKFLSGNNNEVSMTRRGNYHNKTTLLMKVFSL